MDELAKYLAKRSQEICRDNGCTEDEHKCEAYAYINKKGQLLDICCSDYFQGSSDLVAAIPLPFYGTAEDIQKEIDDQCFDESAI